MDFEELINTIFFDLVLEGLGIVFGTVLLWQWFFRQGFSTLFTIFITTLC